MSEFLKDKVNNKSTEALHEKLFAFVFPCMRIMCGIFDCDFASIVGVML